MDQVKFYPNERVDLPDLEAATSELPLDDRMRRERVLILPSGRDDGAAETQARILSGFGATVPGGLGVGQTVVLAKGTAIMPYMDGTTLKFGILHGEAQPDDYTIDYSAAGAGTFAVFVRCILATATAENRLFWDPAGAPASEELDSVETRRVPLWEYASQEYTVSPPGNGEWVKVWEVVVNASNQVTAINDFRHWFFEGSAATADGPYDTEWGSSADRDLDRSAYAIGDLHWFVSMVRTQLNQLIEPTTPGGHVLPAYVDISSLAMEHHGIIPDPAQRGKHKNMDIGDVDRWWTVETKESAGNAGDILEFVAADHSDDGALQLEFLDESGSVVEANLVAALRGLATDLSNGDELNIKLGQGNDSSINWSRFASDRWDMQILAGNDAPGSADVYVNLGAGHPRRGVELGNNGNYYTTWAERSMMVPLNSMQYDTGGLWCLRDQGGTANGDVASQDIAYMQDGSQADDEVYFEIIDFPEGATLASIDVMWRQGSVSGGRNMRMWAARYTWAPAGIGDIASTFWNRLALNSGTNYIEFAPTSGTREARRFTCDQNNAALTKGEDKLLLGFYASDTVQQHMIYGLRLNFLYRTINPWPV